jgi:hypothetical protein
VHEEQHVDKIDISTVPLNATLLMDYRQIMKSIHTSLEQKYSHIELSSNPLTTAHFQNISYRQKKPCQTLDNIQFDHLISVHFECRSYREPTKKPINPYPILLPFYLKYSETEMKWNLIGLPVWNKMNSEPKDPIQQRIYQTYHLIQNDFLAYFDAAMEQQIRCRRFIQLIRDEFLAKLYEPSRMERMEEVYGDAVWGE